MTTPRSDNKPLLILSIFGPSEYNGLWYDLQRRFIRENTTAEYDYKLYLNGVAPEGFERAHILHHSETNNGHPAAMTYLLEHARKHPHNHYLFLDSDCFPIRKGWDDELTRRMHQFDKTIAAPIRVENLDTFPHPCAVFISGAAIHDHQINFADNHSTKNLLGISVQDVGTSMNGMEKVFPLLRTNNVNVHPIAAAIYYHMFYHHGAGSRWFDFRIEQIEYYTPPSDKKEFAERLILELESDPELFIAGLMGKEKERNDKATGWCEWLLRCPAWTNRNKT